MNKEWPEIRLNTFIQCREFPGWKDILGMHDTEDQSYFLMLEKMRESGKVKTIKPGEAT